MKQLRTVSALLFALVVGAACVEHSPLAPSGPDLNLSEEVAPQRIKPRLSEDVREDATATTSSDRGSDVRDREPGTQGSGTGG